MTALAAVGSNAAAQRSMSLYGEIDASAVWLNNVDGGHQYDSIHDHLAPFTPTGGIGGTAFAHPFDNDNTNNSWLARNSLKYTSSTFDGLSFGGMCVWSVHAGSILDAVAL